MNDFINYIPLGLSAISIIITAINMVNSRGDKHENEIKSINSFTNELDKRVSLIEDRNKLLEKFNEEALNSIKHTLEKMKDQL